ncbi:hypothetical protein AADG42_06665 [Ammonicoccus fulvus]|uniref:Secreted protein n=1 Tax=Ammonicoccus fulvus TaxID=3138240 RepID=A0ABZ3FQB2_9ACTN
MTSLRIASALGLAALLLSACGTDPSAAPTPAPTASVPATSAAESTPEPSAPTTPTASKASGTEKPTKGSIITPTPSVVRSSEDAAQAPTPELKAFLEARINELTTDCIGYPRPELVLSEMRVDDLITGEIRACGGGGAAFLWAKVDGEWKVAAVAQAPPSCSELRDAGITTEIPQNFVGHDCMTDAGQMVIFDPNG